VTTHELGWMAAFARSLLQAGAQRTLSNQRLRKKTLDRRPLLRKHERENSEGAEPSSSAGGTDAPDIRIGGRPGCDAKGDSLAMLRHREDAGNRPPGLGLKPKAADTGSL
jgi:hypothetical protein